MQFIPVNSCVFLFQKEPQKWCFKQIYSLNNKQGFTEKIMQVL